MDTILMSIKKVYPVSDASLGEFASLLRPLELPKRSLLIEQGKRDRNVYFIEKGITRSFILIDGKEVTSWFSQEGGLTYSTNGMYGTMKGYENETVQVLEDSLFYYMSMADLESLCSVDINLSNWFRLLYQHAFVEMERRLIYRFHMSAEERYKDFLENHRDLLLRVNLGYVASYLGMSQVTLCALRNKGFL